MSRWLRLAALTCAASLIGTAAMAQELNVGDKAPDFKLQGSDGKTHALADHKGQAVVLAWFPKAFTGGCTAECNSLRESGQAIRQFNAAYYMISVDTPEENKGFAEKEHADFPILSDPTKKVAEAYGVLRAPSVAQPDAPRFAQRWTYYIGPDGNILYIEKAPGTQNAGQNVVAKLKELGIKEKK